MMLKYLLTFFLASVIAVGVSAQGSLSGTWTGKAVKNGQPMGFTLKMMKNGRFLMAYDLNPNDLSVKGTWSMDAEILSFKNSDGILRLRKLPANTTARKKGVMEFKGRRGSLHFSRIKGPFILMGWDEGVAAVVLNPQ